MTHLHLVNGASRPVRGGSVSADSRELILIEEMTRRLVVLDEARGELFAALARHDGDTAVAAARRVRSAVCFALSRISTGSSVRNRLACWGW